MKKYLLLLIVFCFPLYANYALELKLPQYASYQDVKDFTTSLEWNLKSPRQKIQGFREIINRSIYGNRGLNNICKNFRGKGYINPNIPGIVKNLRFIASSSKSQAKGAMRTHIYATEIYHNPEFKLLEVDKLVYDKKGKILTDKDLFFEHKSTGQRFQIEVKEVKPSSQRADIKRLKSQIDKMAKDMKRTGELKVLVNRKKTIPEIKNYAKQKGVLFYENVKTGKKAKIDFNKNILKDLAKKAKKLNKIKNGIGTGTAGIGLLVLGVSSHNIYQELQKENWNSLIIGENTGWAVLGAGMTTAGIGQLAKSSLTMTIGRGAGGVGFVIAEGFIVAQYANDNITTRDFYTNQSGLICALAGAKGGVLIGGSIGGWFGGVGAPVGGVLGGVGGGIIGYFIGTKSANYVYGLLDQQEREIVFTHIYNYYNTAY